MTELTELTLREKIDRARDGRSQSWVIKKMQEQGVPMSDCLFSRKKNGYAPFKQSEKKAIEKILKIKL
jgi:hypothetical protein